MATLNELIYNIKGIIRDNKSDDIKLSDRQLAFMIGYIRAKLIRQDYEKGRSLSANIIQDLGILELERIDRSEDTDFNTGTTILRTKRLIPSPVEVNQKDLIVYVGGVDKMTPIEITSKARIYFSRHNKYTACKNRAYYRNGRIYVENPTKLLQYINVEGVFENPIEVSEFKDDEGVACYDINNQSYPISSHMIQTMNELILTKELNMFLQMTEDTKNDASDELYGRN